jgi:hypothetical protein
MTAGYSLLGAQLNSAPPSLGGYNLCYLRPTANLAAVTGDDYKAPVVASWNVGNGRVLCYLGEADGKYSGAVAKWQQAGEFYATLARWVAGKHEPLPDEMLLTQEIRDGVCFLQLHLDPERKDDPFSNLPRVKILHGLPGAAPAKETVSLAWKNADLLEAAIPIAGRETILNTVEISGQQPVTLPPVCLPYSPEFAPDQPGRGEAALAQIATTTGGKERVEIPKMWDELPVKSRYVELAPWLLVTAAILFLLEIFERRTSRVLRLFGRKSGAKKVAAETVEEKTSSTKEPLFPGLIRKKQSKETAPAKTDSGAPHPVSAVRSKPLPPSASGTESAIDALRKARERAQRRTHKDKED